MSVQLSATIDVASSGDNTAIAAVTGARLNIWKLVILNSAASAQTVNVEDGSNNILGQFPLPSSIGGGVVLDNLPNPLWVLPAGNAFILSLASATAVRGCVWYTLA